MNGWMNGVLGHFYALSRLNWAGTILMKQFCKCKKKWNAVFYVHS